MLLLPVVVGYFTANKAVRPQNEIKEFTGTRETLQ